MPVGASRALGRRLLQFPQGRDIGSKWEVMVRAEVEYDEFKDGADISEVQCKKSRGIKEETFCGVRYLGKCRSLLLRWG